MHPSAPKVIELTAKPVETPPDDTNFVLPKRADVFARYLPFLCVTATSALILSLALFLESTLSLGAVDHSRQAPSQDQLMVATYQFNS